MLDVGAGGGVLTAHLLRAGARVIAIELHDRRVAQLRERFADCDVTVVRADASDLRLPARPFKVVANPPFGVTTALLRQLTARSSRLERASLVLPTWAAARWAAGRGAGRPSGYTFSLGPRVPARAFRPPPPQDARVLVVSRRAPWR